MSSSLQSASGDACPGPAVREGFSLPSLDASPDVEAILPRIPAGATGKGMFANRLLRELSARGLPRPTDETFGAFQDLPLRYCAELNVYAARTLHPGLPLAEALRRVAQMSFETFHASLAGRLVLAGRNHNPHSTFALASRLVGYTTNLGTLQSEHVDARTRLICARDVYFFAEWFGVGMAEGVLHACGKVGTVLVKRHSFVDVDFLIEW